jgi:hypothetical protein
MLQFMYIYFSLIVNSITTGTHFLFIIQQCSIDSAVDDTESVRVPLCHYCIHFRFLEREIILISVHDKQVLLYCSSYSICSRVGFLHILLLDHVNLLGQPIRWIHQHRRLAGEEVVRHRSLLKAKLTRDKRLAVVHDNGQGSTRVKPTL